MLKETRLALRISTTAYDSELVSLIKAAAMDLTVSGGIEVRGLSFAENGEAIQDNSTLADELVKRAIITYVRLHFGSPADYDKLKAAYDEQKAQLMSATGYGISEEFE